MLLDGSHLDFLVFLEFLIQILIDIQILMLSVSMLLICAFFLVVRENSLTSWLMFFSIVFLTIMLRLGIF